MPDLERQVVPPPQRETDPELVAMKRTIDRMQLMYVVLFMTSIVLLVLGIRGMPMWGHVAWGGSLGGAVLTRIIRRNKVSTYNARLLGGGPRLLS